MTPEENVAAVRDFIERAWNRGDEAVFEEHIAADIAHPGGREGFKRMVLGFRAAFPDLVMDVHDSFGAGSRVVTRFTIRGTHQGAFMGLNPTGTQVEFDGIAIDVMDGDKRVDGWAQLDRLALLTQLGAIRSEGVQGTESRK
jgi:predicted ester cyclase